MSEALSAYFFLTTWYTPTTCWGAGVEVAVAAECVLFSIILFGFSVLFTDPFTSLLKLSFNWLPGNMVL